MNEHEVINFGCRLNSYEGEVIKDNLSVVTDNGKVVVVNTCAVTKEAERQAKQSIRKLRRENPDVKIVVTGCAAQINPSKYSNMVEVDKVMGNEEKLSKSSYEFLFDDERVKVNDIMSVEDTASHLVAGFDGKARAFVQVQNGCNHRCTFCIIPYGRGNSRSVPVGDIVKQVKLLVDSGYNEVVITGVDISDYGKDLPGKPTLAGMIKRLLKLVPELARLRLSSIDVAEVDDELLDIIANESRLMPHLHISLQAGDDMVLKRMKRRHLRQDVVDFCHKVRALRPEIAFGADIIAGFPTESDEMFENTLNLVAEAGLQYLHVFPYSVREGTPAAKMPQVKGDIIKKRASMLRSAGDKQLEIFYKNKIGQTCQAIVEQNNMVRCEDFAIVKADCENYKTGQIVEVSIENFENGELFGKLDVFQ